jgi:uncharacterized membrane protein YdbT with pleckstrin-like domain
MEKIQLETDERVLIQVRKHWFILFTQMLGLILGGIFPLVAYSLFHAMGFFDALSTTSLSIPIPAVVALYACWLLIIWMAIFNVWTNYYLDVWTITNKRLIAIDQCGLFNRSTGSFRLERLQDLNVHVNGIIATFLNFGTLEAQTAAGSEEEFRASGLPNPRGLKSLILKATDDLIRSGRSTIQPDGV